MRPLRVGRDPENGHAAKTTASEVVLILNSNSIAISPFRNLFILISRL